MVGTIEKALNPFHLVICFLGCGIFRHSLYHSRLRFSIFYILIVWSVYACTFYYIVTSFPSNKIFYGFLILFVVITNLFAIIISVIITIREHKKFLMCIRNLSLVDDTLEQLGISKEYCKMRNTIKWILTTWFMMICMTWTIDAYWSFENFQEIRALIIPIVAHYPFHVNTIMDMIFIFLLRCIGTRLNKINDYIGQLSETEECGLRCTWKKSRYYIQNAENREHVLWTAIHLHLELCRIARNINAFFGMRITVQMICYFVLLTGFLYFQYHVMLCFKEKMYTIQVELTVLIHTYLWCGICLIKLVTLNYICESVSTKAEKTKDMIHKLTNFVYFDQIRRDICQFILQITLRSLKFNGMGLFYFGYKFICKFVVGIAGIMIFMMQMDTSPLSRILISNESNLTCY